MRQKKVLQTRADILNAYPNGIELLEIGSGDNPEKGYIHLDIQSDLPHLDILADVRSTPIPNNFVSGHIRAVHIMEHFCHPQFSSPKMRKQWGTTTEVLREMYRILKPGGKFLIVTPDFDKITRSGALGLINKDWLQRWSVGGHLNNYDVHHWLWTHRDAQRWFAKAGFVNLHDWNIAKWWKLWFWTKPISGNQLWHNVEWYHWLFFEGTKPEK